MDTSPSFGYHGCYLRIDLSSQQAVKVDIPHSVLKDYIGGAGLGAWLLLKECPASIEPTDPLAPLIFVFSPLVGSPLTTSAKFAVVAKSPLTNRITDSLSSSSFAIAGKKTGCDAIVIVGQASTWSTIVIDDGQVGFHDANNVQGFSSRLTEQALAVEFGPSFRFASIGPAGETQVRFATISNEGRHAGRGGLGCVMGSKLLKSIGVRGTKTVSFAHPEALIEYARDLSKKSFGPATAKYRELGTVSNLLTLNRLGTLPTRNFQQGQFEGSEQISPEAMSQTVSRTRSSCAACTIGCEHIFHLETETKTDQQPETQPVRMEYENLFALGPLCGISDPAIVLKASHYCDEAGLDTISAGGTLAFAMECAERGLIDEPQLRFGDGAALLQTLELITSRTGIGDLLAEGSRRVSHVVGQGSDAFAPHVKGLEIPGYEPRAMQTMALGYAVGTRGADHNRSGGYQVDFTDKVDRMNIDNSAVALAIETEDEAAVMDSLILCKFLRGVFEDRFASMAEMLRLVSGFELSVEELRQTAQRIVTAKKEFNAREGWTPSEDTLPQRFLTEELKEGASSGAVINAERLSDLIQTYNIARGWSIEGWPEESSRSVSHDA
jgi:aldehyde:ferredoxin oxidoreductase